MVRRIILGLLLVGFIALVYLGYKNWSAKRSMLSGDVIAGPSEPLPASSPPLPSIPTTLRKLYPVPASDTPSSSTGQASAPATDSQSPDAPNGARFAGTGRYQVYRQGNLTYRFNTDTGQSCVLYATKEEWQRPEVYRHGCGSSAAQ
jgi:hypothetical protein